MAQKPKQSTSNSGLMDSDELMNSAPEKDQENKCKFQDLDNHYLVSFTIDDNNKVDVKYCAFVTSAQIRAADMEQTLRNVQGENNNSEEDLRKASREIQPPFIAAVQATKEHKGMLIIGHTNETMDEKQVEERLNNHLWVSYMREATPNYTGGSLKSYDEVTGGKTEPLTDEDVEFLRSMAEMQ